MTSKRKPKRKKRSSGEVTPDREQKQTKIVRYLHSQEIGEINIEEENFSISSKMSDIPGIMESPKESTTNITDTVTSPTQTLKEIIRDMNHKLGALKTIHDDINDLRNDMKQIMEAVKFSEAQLSEACIKVKDLSDENVILKTQIGTLNHQNSLMLERVIEQENYSRRENIVISGLAENRGENCLFVVQELFTHVGFEHIFIQRCHRIGARRQQGGRDMIVRLLHYPDKMMILRSRSKFPRGVYVNEDFSAETNRRINVLRPVYKEAKKIDSTTSMHKDKLYFKNKEYSLKNIRSINLDTSKLSEKHTKDVFAFAGRFSPLSNHYPQPIEIDNLTYASSEHYYQHQKCLSSGDQKAAAAVLLAAEPEDAMAAGFAVKQTPEWTKEEGIRIMEKAIRAKFNCEHMKAKLKLTGTRQLVEATRNKLWGIGQPFTSPNVLQPGTYSGQNFLGKLLMKLRDDLLKS